MCYVFRVMCPFHVTTSAHICSSSSSCAWSFSNLSLSLSLSPSLSLSVSLSLFLSVCVCVVVCVCVCDCVRMCLHRLHVRSARRPGPDTSHLATDSQRHRDFRPPPAQKPAPNSEYDLTSIMATVRKLLPGMGGMPPLTKRDAWAGTFEHVFSMGAGAGANTGAGAGAGAEGAEVAGAGIRSTGMATLRTDCPMHLPPAPPRSKELPLHVESELVSVRGVV
jgi:hypothetical protein